MSKKEAPTIKAILFSLHQEVLALECEWLKYNDRADLEVVMDFRNRVVEFIDKINSLRAYIRETRQALFFIAYGINTRLTILNPGYKPSEDLDNRMHFTIAHGQVWSFNPRFQNQK